MHSVAPILIAFLLAALMASCTSGPRGSEGSPAGGRGHSEALEPLAFLVGSRREWRGGALIEETWSRPHGPGMVGHFRWCRADGSVMVYELLSLSHEPTAEDPGAVHLRIRHFSGTLVAKEEKDAPLTLKLARSSVGEAEFVAHAHCGDVSRIVYRDAGSGVLQVRVEFSQASARKALEFVYRKV
ncbi:MAG: hypothetical protein K2Q20_11100 [Phycisphaerales bacterium]|nr:hypothetical protein [Phycisphaerales bacterium]